MYSKKRITSGILIVLVSLAVGIQSQASFSIASTKSNEAVENVTKSIHKSAQVKKTSKNLDETAITRAEISTMLTNIFVYQLKSEKKFADVKASDWYSEAALKVDMAGILKRDTKGNFNGDKPVTRQEAALILYRAFYLTELGSKKTVKIADSKEVSKVYKTAVECMVFNGYMSTRSENKFAPREYISKDEITTILNNMTGEIKSSAGTYTKNITGNLVINEPGVKLKDMTIQGDLYIAPGVGEGNISLEGVTVKGRVVVLGGGENSIELNNTIVTQELITAKSTGKVRIAATGTTSIAKTRIDAGTTLHNAAFNSKAFGEVTIKQAPLGHNISFSGNFDNVKVEAAKAAITLTKGTLQNVEITKAAKGATVTLEESTTLVTLVVRGEATITGKGAIGTANIEVKGVIISQEPAKVIMGDNITAVIAGIVRSGNQENRDYYSGVSNNEGSTDGGNTGGDNTGGDNTGEGNTGGSNTGGDNTGGENSGEENPGGIDNGGTNPVSDSHTVKIIEFEYVRYLVIHFANGSLKDYSVTVDGQNVEFTPVTTDMSIVKYEVKDRKEHKVLITQGTKMQEYSIK